MNTDRTWRGRLFDLAVGAVVIAALACARFATKFLPARQWKLDEGPDLGEDYAWKAAPLQVALLRRLRRQVPRLSRWVPWRAVCLEQALAARWILRQARVPSRLQVGVSSSGGVFAAHAWLEVAGKTLIGGDQDRPYRIFETQRRRG